MRARGSREPDARPQFIYFVLSPSMRRVKIGITRNNPNRRFHNLRAMNAGPLVPLAVIGFAPQVYTTPSPQARPTDLW